MQSVARTAGSQPMDIRELEDFNRIPAKDGGDEYLVNGNMLPVKDAEQFYQTKTTGSNQA